MIVAALAIMALAIGIYAYRLGLIVSPDGGSYLLAAGGIRQPSPFRWRLLPHLFRSMLPPTRALETAARVAGWGGIGQASERAVVAWTALSYACLLACGPLLATYASQRGANGLLAVALFAGLPWLRSCVRMPCLTDQAGMALALAAGCSSEHAWALILIGAVAGLVSERAPAFAALFAWSPWPLLGLAIPIAVALLMKPGPLQPWHRGILDRPFASARERHAAAPLWVFAAPWGLALVGFGAMTWQLAVTLGVAAGQMVVATDRVRLYQTAAPVLCVAASSVMVGWSPAMVAVGLMAHAVVPWTEERG